MDVLRLNSTFKPDELVEDYASMIWTERKLEAGEFELRTAKVEETKLQLPEGSLISLLDSEEVMIAETHSIQRDDAGVAELVVTGRTFETFAENRVQLADIYGEEWPAPQLSSTADIVAALLWSHLANATGQDPLRWTGLQDPRIVVPNLIVTDSTTIVEDDKAWYLKDGEVYAMVKDFLSLASLGIRNIRPHKTSGNVVSVDTTPNTGNTRGTVTKTTTSDIDQLRIDLYNGLDRSREQSTNTPVVFRYDSGHINSPSYLLSLKDYKNLAIASSSIGVFDVWPEDTPPSPIPTGLDLRALPFDGGTKDEAQTNAEFQAALTQKARIELKKHNRKVIFDGAISVLSPYEYNKEYFLGDKVTLSAEYGFEETMEVVEYVRTEDQSGDRGYPTLVLAE